MFILLAIAFCVIVVININSGNVHIPISQIVKILFTHAGPDKDVNIIWHPSAAYSGGGGSGRRPGDIRFSAADVL